MRHILYKYLTGASMIALTFSLNTSTANATCSPMPTCEELGYNKTDCGSGESIKCPFDKTKMKCLADPCANYPIQDYHACSSEIGTCELCPANTYKARYTSCTDKYYLGAGVYAKVYATLVNGLCIRQSCEAHGYKNQSDLSSSLPSGIIYDYEHQCIDNFGQNGSQITYYKLKCVIGTYFEGKCLDGNVNVGDIINISGSQVIVFEVGNNYVKVLSPTGILGDNSKQLLDNSISSANIYITNDPATDDVGNWDLMKQYSNNASYLLSSIGYSWRLPTGQELETLYQNHDLIKSKTSQICGTAANCVYQSNDSTYYNAYTYLSSSFTSNEDIATRYTDGSGNKWGTFPFQVYMGGGAYRPHIPSSSTMLIRVRTIEF